MIDEDTLRNMAALGANKWSATETHLVVAQAVEANRLAKELAKAVALLHRTKIFRTTRFTEKLADDRRDFLKPYEVDE